MAVGQLGKSFPGGSEEMPEPPYSRAGQWWRPGPADLIYRHRVPSQRGWLRPQLVTRHYVAFSFSKGGDRVPCPRSEPTAAQTMRAPGSGTDLAVATGLSL